MTKFSPPLLYKGSIFFRSMRDWSDNPAYGLHTTAQAAYSPR